MEKVNEEFNIPYYIFEEITEYVELTALGHKKSMKWENIKSLLNLAVINKRITCDWNLLINQLLRIIYRIKEIIISILFSKICLTKLKLMLQWVCINYLAMS